MAMGGRRLGTDGSVLEAIRWVFISIVKSTRVRLKEDVDEIPRTYALGNIP